MALAVLILMGILFFLNKSFKKVFLTVIISLIILQVSYSGCLAQEEGTHLYSTWDILELDTCASAWLIKRFIDSQAEFKFYLKGEIIEQGIAFDTPDAQFKRSHNMSCFESLLKEYKIDHKALIKIGNIIHDIEVNFWLGNISSQADELNQKILDIIEKSSTPEETFRKSFSVFDKLYEQLKAKGG